jgi:hypothetical protein
VAHNRPSRPQDAACVCAQCAHNAVHSAPSALKARTVAQLAVARWRTNLGKVYTANFTIPWCTRLTRLRAPAHSEEGGRRRGRTHRRDRRRRMASVVGGIRPRPGKLLRCGWVLRDLPRKKGGGLLGLMTVTRSRKEGRKRRHPYRQTVKPVARTKMHREGPFYSFVGGGWMGWMGWLSLGS